MRTKVAGMLLAVALAFTLVGCASAAAGQKAATGLHHLHRARRALAAAASAPAAAQVQEKYYNSYNCRYYGYDCNNWNISAWQIALICVAGVLLIFVILFSCWRRQRLIAAYRQSGGAVPMFYRGPTYGGQAVGVPAGSGADYNDPMQNPMHPMNPAQIQRQQDEQQQMAYQQQAAAAYQQQQQQQQQNYK